MGTTNYILCNLAIKYMLSGMSINNIAAALGYSNVQSFNKAFKRNRGFNTSSIPTKVIENAVWVKRRITKKTIKKR